MYLINLVTIVIGHSPKVICPGLHTGTVHSRPTPSQTTILLAGEGTDGRRRGAPNSWPVFGQSLDQYEYIYPFLYRIMYSDSLDARAPRNVPSHPVDVEYC